LTLILVAELHKNYKLLKLITFKINYDAINKTHELKTSKAVAETVSPSFVAYAVLYRQHEQSGRNQ